jgi:transcriptional regulator with XRE-family HTH domain
MPEQAEIRRALGRALKDLRMARSVTQEELSGRTGVHPTYISDIERGARNPSWESLVKLADGLGMTMADLGAVFDRLR